MWLFVSGRLVAAYHCDLVGGWRGGCVFRLGLYVLLGFVVVCVGWLDVVSAGCFCLGDVVVGSGVGLDWI